MVLWNRPLYIISDNFLLYPDDDIGYINNEIRMKEEMISYQTIFIEKHIIIEMDFPQVKPNNTIHVIQFIITYCFFLIINA